MSEIIDDYTITIEQNPDRKIIDYIGDNLSLEAEIVAGFEKDRVKLGILVRGSDNSLKGGLIAEISWKWLYIFNIWIQEGFRHKGIGTRLLKTAEEEAKKRGCGNACLETFSYQARPLYERLGYEVFGQLDDFPPGYTKYFMKKVLG